MIPSLKLKKTEILFKHTINKWLTVALLTAFGFVSCVDENNQLGLDLVKSNGGMDILHSPDNITEMESCVYKTDSLETGQKDNFVLGSYKDSFFGSIQTSIYTSLSLQDNSGYDFSAMGTIDSAVLCLAYNMQGSFKKDTSVTSDDMQINVWQLSQDMDSTMKYSCSEAEVQNDMIFSQTVNVNPQQGIILDGDTVETNPHIRMSLNENFVNKLRQGRFEKQSDFQQEFKGIKISAKSSSDSYLASIDMKSSNSGIFVYYHDKEGNKGRYMINFTQSGYRFMCIDKDYSSSRLAALTNDQPGDTLRTQDYIYIASLGIAEACLDLKNIDNWYKQDSIKGAALNRAELILPVAQTFGQTHLYPSSLIVFRKQDGKYFYLSDELAQENWLGNKYDADINAYRLDITSFLQRFLNGQYDNCELYIVPDNRNSSASRVVLTGMDNENPPKLNIIYSHPARD